MVRKNKGRQKIEMKKMQNETNLQVTFSKRRSGLFKKASELCTLCNVQITIIVFSPSGKVFSFGHPNVDDIIDRFSNANRPRPHQHNNMQLSETSRNIVVQNLNEHLTQVTNDLEEEKKKSRELKRKGKDTKVPGSWWEDDVEKLDLSKLTQFKNCLESLKQAVANETSKHVQEAAGPRRNFYAGSSSNAAAFGRSGGDTNITTEFDLFNHRRMVSMNAFNQNHNMIVPHHTSFGNNGKNIEGSHNHMMIVPHHTSFGNNYGNITEGSHNHNMLVPYDPAFGTNGNNTEGSHNFNMIVPYDTLVGNNGNNFEGFVPQHNVNYRAEYNQNQSQHFKQEDSSDECAHHLRHFGRN